jgi:hypothetical protein
MTGMTSAEIKVRVQNFGMWIDEGRRFPNNYDNIRKISELSTDLIYDLLDDRKLLIGEIKRLKKLVSENGR